MGGNGWADNWMDSSTSCCMEIWLDEWAHVCKSGDMFRSVDGQLEDEMNRERTMRTENNENREQ